MRPLILFVLILPLFVGCSTNRPHHQPGYPKQSRVDRNGQKFPSVKGNLNSPEYRRSPKDRTGNRGSLVTKNTPSPRDKPAGFFSSNGRNFLPTVTHLKDRSLMVLVNQGTNRVSQLHFSRGVIRPDPADSGAFQPRAFYMDLMEITVDQYRSFDATYDEKPFTNGEDCPDCPAMGIDWASANRYCHWAGKRLPTEAEWVAAAGGNTGDLWPWGNSYSPERANLSGNEDGSFLAAPVGSHPQGASPYGLLDMTGNVWEWVGDPSLSTQKGSKQTTLRIVKGGGWTSDKQSGRISYRNIVDPAMKNPTIGFRCAKSLLK